MPVHVVFLDICWTRKPALSNSPVDCCNRRGFSAEKRVQQGEPKEIDMNFHVDFFMPVGLRKAALSNSPVDCCNQLGFLQKSESNRGLRIDALFILRYFLEKFVFKIEISFGCVSG